MTLEQRADELIISFVNIGLPIYTASKAAKMVAEHRLNEAILHSMESSRCDYWEKIKRLIDTKIKQYETDPETRA